MDGQDLPIMIKLGKNCFGFYNSYIALYKFNGHISYICNPTVTLEKLAENLALQSGSHPVRSINGIKSSEQLEIDGNIYGPVTYQERKRFFRLYEEKVNDLEERNNMHINK